MFHTSRQGGQKKNNFIPEENQTVVHVQYIYNESEHRGLHPILFELGKVIDRLWKLSQVIHRYRRKFFKTETYIF